MFDIYPRHGHRSPQQIAEDTGGSFEPMRATRRPEDAANEKKSAKGSPKAPSDDNPSAKRKRDPDRS